MTEEIKKAIETLIKAAAEAGDATEAMKFSQAALNIWQIQYNFSFPPQA